MPRPAACPLFACGPDDRAPGPVRHVTLQLDRFGIDALERYAPGQEDVLLRAATLYYMADRDAERPGWRAPRFLRATEPPATGGRFSVDDLTWAALDREAMLQGIETERLAGHALLYYLADLDSGRLAQRLDFLAGDDVQHQR